MIKSMCLSHFVYAFCPHNPPNIFSLTILDHYNKAFPYDKIIIEIPEKK